MPELEARLGDLGRALAYPQTPDLAPAVLARLAADTRPAPRRRRLILVLAAAATLVAVGALMTVPQTRGAILRFLHLRGATIERVETLPEVRGAIEPGLGRKTSLDDASRTASWTLVLPAALGQPDGVYRRTDPPGGMITFVYGDTGDPAALFSQFLGGVDYVEKSVGPGTRVEPLTVGGEPGYWISGEPHVFSYADRDAEYREEETRLAGNVLLWEDGDLLLRLEADMTKSRALDVALSLVPAGS